MSCNVGAGCCSVHCAGPRPSPGADLHCCTSTGSACTPEHWPHSNCTTAPSQRAPHQNHLPPDLLEHGDWFCTHCFYLPRNMHWKDMCLLTPAANPSCPQPALPSCALQLWKEEGSRFISGNLSSASHSCLQRWMQSPLQAPALQGPCSDLQAISTGAKLAPGRQITNLLLVWLCFSSATWQLTRHWNCWDKVIPSVDLGFRHPEKPHQNKALVFKTNQPF